MRWYKKFKNLSRPRVNVDTIYQEDVIHTFFINCYHLKDWLANETGLSLKSEIEQAINSSDAMVLCDCVANGTKHKTLRATPRRQQINSLELKSAINMTVVVGAAHKNRGSYNWYILVNNQTKVDGLQLATDCVRFWQDYLKSKGMLKEN